MQKKLLLIIGLWTGFTVQTAIADQSLLFKSADHCPKSISVNSSSSVPLKVWNVLKSVYFKVGCTVELSVLPGRRGIVHFNNMITDGEVMRLPVIEAEYTRDHIRTAKPLFENVNAVWRVQSPQKYIPEYYGYAIGTKWQENYVRRNAPEYEFIAFTNQHTMVKAANRGLIKGYLSSQIGVFTTRTQGILNVDVSLEREISRLPVYHYLGAEFDEVMGKIDHHMSERDLFYEIKGQTSAQLTK